MISDFQPGVAEKLLEALESIPEIRALEPEDAERILIDFTRARAILASAGENKDRLEDAASRFAALCGRRMRAGFTDVDSRICGAFALERRLFDVGRACTVIDGQNMRLGISRDLGFTTEDRSENLRRAAEVAKLMNDAGLICVAAFVAPDDNVRRKAAEVVGTERFLLVHLSAPIEYCRQRDPDGKYAAAESGEIANFPGVSAPYEEPRNADLVLPTHELSVSKCVDRILELLAERGIVS